MARAKLLLLSLLIGCQGDPLDTGEPLEAEPADQAEGWCETVRGGVPGMAPPPS